MSFPKISNNSRPVHVAEINICRQHSLALQVHRERLGAAFDGLRNPLALP